MAAFLAPFCFSLLAANYLTTCIGWLPLLGLEIEPPPFTGGYHLGCLLLLAVWIAMSFPALLRGDHRRAKRQPCSTFVQESMFGGEALGWATILQLAVWLFFGATVLF